MSYYTQGGVAIATGRPGNWSTEQVADVTPSPSPSPIPSPSPSPSPTAGGGAKSPSPTPAPEPEPIETEPSTGVAVDGEGMTWVAWEDIDGVHLASTGDGGDLEEQELSQSEGGVTPSVAVTEDGSSVYLAWFDPEEADLRVGVSADLGELQLAAPSPTPPLTGGQGPAGCGKGEEGSTELEIVAAGTAFNTACLVAAAGQPFTITLDNQDAFAHNISIYADTGYTEPVQQTPLEGAPVSDSETYEFKPIDAGTLYFQCDFHPQPSMRGTFAVVGGGGGQGGGGGGGQGGGGGGGG